MREFLKERLPLTEFSEHLRKPLPKHINLLFSLGSLAMFLLLLQAATGAFLALYYSPSPEHAHNAVTYISEEVPFGAFVRGLHHWGASAMVIIVFLHLLRVVLYGSYKAPRELTWIFGVLLLLVVLGFGFTGYLLPWDEKAYWATVVGVEIASTAPVLGDFVAKVLRGGAEIGAVTLSRFYALHTIWLPWLAFGLVGVHLFFVRYYGSSGIPQNTPEEMPSQPIEEGKPFYPHQVFEDVVGMLILFVVLACVALFVPVPLEDVADPTNADYDPRPEWYFLFLFQLLKYFQGPLEIIGTFVIPTVGMVLLLLLPFLDRSERAVLWKRPIALTVTSVSVVAIVGLTILGASSPKLETQEAPQPTAEIENTVPTEAVEEAEEVFDFQLTEEEIEGTEEAEEVFDFQLTEEEIEGAREVGESQ
ncbi:MAG: cytochrome bc complex cytochrome b subunit [Candidatus Poribacteria bacterium]|nr:cytochrome bc complex cytochrome b subunit [Candidatus Poribacteria bacterium]